MLKPTSNTRWYLGASILVVSLSLGCGTTAQAQPAGENCPNRRECVNIVVDGSGCPQYTTYKGVRDAVPNLSKSDARRMWFYIVDENARQQEIEFQAYFDPFKKPELAGVGRAQSQRLDRDVPTDVNFKYTVTVQNCTPMDPLIRISR